MKEAMRPMQGLLGAGCGGGSRQPQHCFSVGWCVCSQSWRLQIKKKERVIKNSAFLPVLCEMGSEMAPALIGYPE